ncbi:hypothetical protein RHO13_10785 [Orbus wheelerorum]|uniref:hypothetical protein n=1 Tax=Orbus wheelerorum TaxID=3074111 RepID=UPI00370D3ECE
MGAKVAGGIGAIFTLYDGASSCIASYQRIARGEVDGSGYLVGSLCQLSSGLLGIISLFFLNPVVALAAFIFGVMAFILLWLFKDKSDDWTLMQTWFNRSYFGLWSHKAVGKGEPYPLTDIGAYIACNDYLVALLNCQVTMAIKDGASSFPNLESSAVPAGYLPVSSLRRNVQLNLFLSDFDSDKSSYQGQLVIRSKLNPKRYIVLSLSNKESYINIMQKQSTLDKWQYREIDKVPFDENKENYSVIDEKGNKKVISNSISDAKPVIPISNNNNNGIIYFLRASQVIGWLDDDIVDHYFELEAVVHYYRDKSQNAIPLVLCYEYS